MLFCVAAAGVPALAQEAANNQAAQQEVVRQCREG